MLKIFQKNAKNILLNTDISIIIKAYPVGFCSDRDNKKSSGRGWSTPIPQNPLCRLTTPAIHKLLFDSTTTDYYYSITMSFLQDVLCGFNKSGLWRCALEVCSLLKRDFYACMGEILPVCAFFVVLAADTWGQSLFIFLNRFF